MSDTTKEGSAKTESEDKSAEKGADKTAAKPAEQKASSSSKSTSKAATPAKAAAKPVSTSKSKPKAPAVRAPDEDEAKVIGDSMSVGSVLEETETIQAELPPTLEYVDSMKDTIKGHAFVLSLYDPYCLECSALVPSLAEDDDDDSLPECHFKNGNPHCPAGYHRFQIVGKRLSLLRKIKTAQSKGDDNRITALISNQLPKLTGEDRKWVLEQAGIIKKSE